ncbi:RNA polymerase sigma factor [Lentzea sp. CA-135723]|uniref:RNA polymerase sigma factor n=1 Tax=Lentzea sp. CA-135723 TaxID=3239950 RepID=UPI003D89BDE5
MIFPDPDEVRARIADLYQRYVIPVRLQARRLLRDESAIDDVTQEVFIAAYNQLKRELAGEPHILIDTGQSAQLSWLRTVTRNKCIDRLRVDCRIEPTENIALVVPPTSNEPLRQALDKDMSRRLWSVLVEHATARELQVVELAFREELTSREIAELLGVSIETVRSHKNHVKKKIENVIPEIIFPSDSGDDAEGIEGGR